MLHACGPCADETFALRSRIVWCSAYPRADVDDLKTGRGAEYVDMSSVSLIFCSRGYFTSPNCMRELLRSVVTKKPLLALLEPEVSTRRADGGRMEPIVCPCCLMLPVSALTVSKSGLHPPHR